MRALLLATVGLAMIGFARVEATDKDDPRVAKSTPSWLARQIPIDWKTVRRKPPGAVTLYELDQLHKLFMASLDEHGKPPAAKDLVKELRSFNARLVAKIDNGLIVLTDKRDRTSIWAYEKGAPENGGNVVVVKGIIKMSAEQLQKALKK